MALTDVSRLANVRANRRNRACISYDEESATEMVISKCPDNAEALKISIFEDFDFSVVDWATATNGLFSFVWALRQSRPS